MFAKIPLPSSQQQDKILQRMCSVFSKFAYRIYVTMTWVYAIACPQTIGIKISLSFAVDILPLARKINCRLLNCSSASIFRMLQCRSKLVKTLYECQIACIWIRRRVTRRLIQIQAVCIWNYSCAWRAKS